MVSNVSESAQAHIAPRLAGLVATAFLASDYASLVTGAAFLADGGISAAYVTLE